MTTNTLSPEAVDALSRALAGVDAACTSFDVPALIMGNEDEHSKLHPRTCECNGTGRIKRWPNGLDDWYREHGEKVCGTCKGKGEVVIAPVHGDMVDPRWVGCPACSGTGKQRGVERLYSYERWEQPLHVIDVYTALLMVADLGWWCESSSYADLTYGYEAGRWETWPDVMVTASSPADIIAQVLAAEGVR